MATSLTPPNFSAAAGDAIFDLPAAPFQPNSYPSNQNRANNGVQNTNHNSGQYGGQYGQNPPQNYNGVQTGHTGAPPLGHSHHQHHYGADKPPSSNSFSSKLLLFAIILVIVAILIWAGYKWYQNRQLQIQLNDQQVQQQQFQQWNQKNNDIAIDIPPNGHHLGNQLGSQGGPNQPGKPRKISTLQNRMAGVSQGGIGQGGSSDYDDDSELRQNYARLLESEKQQQVRIKQLEQQLDNTYKTDEEKYQKMTTRIRNLQEEIRKLSQRSSARRSGLDLVERIVEITGQTNDDAPRKSGTVVEDISNEVNNEAAQTKRFQNTEELALPELEESL